MVQASLLKGFIVYGFAVTPLHPGAGRALGPVDQIVQRDAMGYPMVYSSSVKGAFKAECARRADRHHSGAARDNASCFDDRGRIICNNDKCRICCCLFGSEPGDEPSETGVLSVLDFVPLFIPVPSLDLGYVYVTTPYLLRRALSVVETVGHEDMLKLINSLLKREESVDERNVASTIERDHIYVSTTRFAVKKIGIEGDLLKLVEGLGGLAHSLGRKLVVMGDSIGRFYIEKGLIRVTRVRLRLDTKTVAEDALWEEEYIPQGTVFLGGFAITVPKRNRYCCSSSDECKSILDENTIIEKFRKIMYEQQCQTYAIIGGKETVGRGLLKLLLHPCETQKNSGAGR